MFLCLLIVCLIVVAVANGQDYPKVRVELYYEALCPGCQEFITGSLTRTLANDDIAAIVDLKMVPYVSSIYDNVRALDDNFSC
jgi:interferon, gamma-inducible protein 30